MDSTNNLRCPECRAVLKKRRTRSPDACEMICGGCSRRFNVCEDATLQELGRDSGNTEARSQKDS